MDGSMRRTASDPARLALPFFLLDHMDIVIIYPFAWPIYRTLEG
jgi:hypothetical protein